MKSIVFLALFLGLACAAFTEYEYQTAFVNWMKEHGRSYGSHEFSHRYNAFKWNMDYVTEWNAQNYTSELALNFLADLTNEEYQRIYLGTKIDATGLVGEYEYDFSAAPGDNDWRTQGAVTGVKDQGQCGSCWSFSTTGSIEGAYKIAGHALVSLSEQNLMDCSGSYGNQGCNGGLMDNAFKYVIANKGIDTEASYPYETKQGACRFKAANIGATISGYTDVPSGNEGALTTAIAGRPVSVAIDASKSSFQMYSTGVYYEATCSSTRLDHGVLAVGSGTNSGAAMYIVKNSWGTRWGQAGYIYMSRGRNNNCGIATSASYPKA